MNKSAVDMCSEPVDYSEDPNGDAIEFDKDKSDVGDDMNKSCDAMEFDKDTPI
jgi:hypothetical protein